MLHFLAFFFTFTPKYFEYFDFYEVINRRSLLLLATTSTSPIYLLL